MFSMFNRLSFDYVYFKVSKTYRQIWSIVRRIVTGRFSVREIENAVAFTRPFAIFKRLDRRGFSFVEFMISAGEVADQET